MVLGVSGAEIVSPRDFRMTDGGGHSEYALVSTKIRLWAGPVRRDIRIPLILDPVYSSMSS